MDKSQLTPVANILLPAYLDASSYSKEFSQTHGQPPTSMAKVHHMRSVAQASLSQSDRYILAGPFVEFGRVEFQDTEHDRSYLLRSGSAVEIERAKRQGQTEALFDSSEYLVSETHLLIFKFHEGGLDLSIAGATHKRGKFKLEISGAPTYISTWPYTFEDSSTPFDQGAADPFSELGGMDDFGVEESE